MRSGVLLLLLACSASPTTSPADARPVAADARACGVVEYACGQQDCAPGEYCTLQYPGVPNVFPDGGVCPDGCAGYAQVGGCFCPAAHCNALPAGCRACDCLPLDAGACYHPWQCCEASTGPVASCPAE